MKISVIIPCFKDFDLLEKCLHALKNQSLSSSEFEILILDNNPQPMLKLRDMPANTFIYHQPKPGSYSARNLGALKATGELLAFTDSDCIPQKDWLKNGLHLFESNDAVERLGGKILISYKNTNRNWVELYESIYAFDQETNTRKGLSVTANFWVRKDAFFRYGPFAEDLFSGGDFQWNRVATSQGSKMLYAENVVVTHPARNSFDQLRRKAQRVAGGQHGALLTEKSNPVHSTFKLLWELRPPVFEFKKIGSAKGLNGPQKLKVWLVRYWFRTLKAKEQFKIEFYGKKAANT